MALFSIHAPDEDVSLVAGKLARVGLNFDVELSPQVMPPPPRRMNGERPKNKPGLTKALTENFSNRHFTFKQACDFAEEKGFSKGSVGGSLKGLLEKGVFKKHAVGKYYSYKEEGHHETRLD